MRKLKNSELNRISIEQFKEVKKTPIVIVLDNIRSQNNTGSVFRTADAFLIESIFLCGFTATPPHRTSRRGTSPDSRPGGGASPAGALDPVRGLS